MRVRVRAALVDRWWRCAHLRCRLGVQWVGRPRHMVEPHVDEQRHAQRITLGPSPTLASSAARGPSATTSATTSGTVAFLAASGGRQPQRRAMQHPAIEGEVAAGVRPAGVRAAHRAAARVGHGRRVDWRGDGQHDRGRATTAQVGDRGEVRVDACAENTTSGLRHPASSRSGGCSRRQGS